MKFDTRPLSAGLYFVATPIGTARDITLRALDVLATADVLAAEDTRTARKLMDIHGIPLGARNIVAYHDHSSEGTRERLIAMMREGQSLAYVSEAGMPLVADPGYALGRAAIAAGLTVFSIPGPSAALTALTVSGLPTDRFTFLGFLPTGQTQRRTALAEISDWQGTCIVYESPKRVNQLLGDVCEILGERRQIAICRELTKKFEEVRRGPAGALRDALADQSLRGEVVVLIGPGEEKQVDAGDLEAALRAAMADHRMKDAATLVAGAFGLPKREVYQMALRMNEEDDNHV